MSGVFFFFKCILFSSPTSSDCQNNTFGIYWISCILLFLNSPLAERATPSHRNECFFSFIFVPDDELCDFIALLSQCKVRQKKISLLPPLSFSRPTFSNSVGIHNDDVWLASLLACDLTQHEQPY